ncbi:DNA-3-methyladenine glycosylase [Clostridium neonatale]|nr:DNA-3-methyladenine glycosylase [Clostridium neonatale]
MVNVLDFIKIDDTNYIVVAFEKVIELKQDGNNIFIYNSNEEDVKNIWIKYFDLERDYSEIQKELSKDELLRKSVEFGPGIRILNQDPFEILISFIISARNSIPSIMKTINKISIKYGREIEYKDTIYYAFPTIDQIKDATLEEIQETGASFRSKYIVDTISNVYKSKEAIKSGDVNAINEFRKYSLDYIKSLNDDECHVALQEFKGVGAKVADCIMLFSMEKYSAFPVDVWVKRAMVYFYGAEDASLNKIRIFGRNKFGKLSGFAQQYLFYYARENKIKIEE